MKHITYLFFMLPLAEMLAQAPQVNMQISTSSASQKTISPYIYGLNGYVYDTSWGSSPWATGLSNHGGFSNLDALNVTSWRLGGNSMTPYNWEQGANNSGNDDAHKNSIFQSYIVTGNNASSAPNFYSPAQALVTTQNHALSLNAAALIQLPMAGYVAADVTGTTCGNPLLTPSRWKQVVNTKPTPFTLSPNLSDGVIYVDEEINFLKNQFGDATTANGIKFYQTDNEVGLWSHYLAGGGGSGADGTHSVMHPNLTTCNEVISKTYDLAKTIKTVDANAKVFSSGRWGYMEAYSLWNIWDGSSHQPSDWASFNIEPYKTNGTGNTFRYNQMTWQNAFLAAMKQKETIEGKRLLDVLAFHYYPEGISTDADRLQAPRSLWDSNYVENSWITQIGNGLTEGRGLRMIPLTQQAINDFYPGTKMAITEYDFGGRTNISGTIAQADALGIFGKYDIYYATYFGIADQYIAPAFKIFRNYDGTKKTFGSISIQSSTSNVANTSIYASIEDVSANVMHIILINKSSLVVTASINITGSTLYSSITDAYGISETDGNNLVSAKSKLNSITGTSIINSNSLSYQMQPKSVYHLVLKTSSATSVQESLKPFTFSIVPNPTINNCLITSSDAIKQISVIDISGRVIKELTTEGINSINVLTYDLSKGIYFIKVINEFNQSKIEKLIIN